MSMEAVLLGVTIWIKRDNTRIGHSCKSSKKANESKAHCSEKKKYELYFILVLYTFIKVKSNKGKKINTNNQKE